MSIRLCLGEYAKNGFEPETIGTVIYSVEELCFFIRENACLLEEGFMEEKLIVWLEKECGLSSLAEELKKALRKKVSLKTFVDLILTYTGFFSAEARKEILFAITENSTMNVYEKRKAKADAFLEKGQVGLAGREYERLLEQLPEEERLLKGQIYHCCGVCLARLFYWKMAAKYFKRAYEITGKMDSFSQYLLAMRFSMPEAEYLQFLGENGIYEDSLRLEEQLEEWKADWEDSSEARLLKQIQEEKESNSLGYQQKLEQRIEVLKDAYREMLNQPR